MNYHNPALQAEAVLLNCWDGHLPVDAVAVAESLGVSVFKSTDLSYSCLLQVGDKGATELILNGFDPLQRRRFAIAHALWYFVQGRLTKSNRAIHITSREFSAKVTDKDSMHANEFAVSLLIPKPGLELAVSSGYNTVQKLSRLFVVSEVAVKRRMQQLGI